MRIEHIFLADDDIDDVELFQEALGEICDTCTLTNSKDGHELLTRLNTTGHSLPQVLFIDVNMPMMDGLDCLEQIKLQQSLKDIPVIILTTSVSPVTVERAYSLGANMFMVKPTDFRDLKNMITKVIETDWANYRNPEMDNFIYRAC